MIPLGVFIVLLFLFSLISRRSLKTIITAPILFTAVGILMVVAVPDSTDINIQDKTFLVISEITLALVLFADATHINLRKVMRPYWPPSWRPPMPAWALRL
jgi:NhaP-type Na+/H+ or K+/H+ antiporter